MTHLSLNCRERQDQPNSTHHCHGCDCRCHHKAAPPDFRDLVEAAKPKRDVCADGIECMARDNVGEPCCGRDAG